MRILLISIHGHDGKCSIGTLHSICRHQLMPRAVGNIRPCGKYLVLTAAGLRPFEIDQLRDKKLREWLLNLIICIDREHPEGPRRTVTSRLHVQGEIVKKINALSSRVEERSDIVCQPESAENILVGFACARRKVSFGDKHRHIRWDSVFMPDLHDVAYKFGFVIQHAPRRSAWIKWIMFE